MPTAISTQPELYVQRAEDGTLTVRLVGPWSLEAGLPPLADVERELTGPSPKAIDFDTEGLTAWDSSVLAFLAGTSRLARERGVPVDTAGLPEGLRRLLVLAEAVPERADARAKEGEGDFVEKVGERALEAQRLFESDLDFLGKLVL